MKEFIIDNKTEGQRIDKYLHKLMPNAGTSFLFKMMRKKNITLNHKKSSGNEKLVAGDIIQIFFSDETFQKMSETERESNSFMDLAKLPCSHISVIYENEDYLILNKPTGMLSQKAKDTDISMNEEVLSYLIQKQALSEDDYRLFHPSVANRLDRNTSGILLAGKTLKGQQFLSELLKSRTVKKLYHAIVLGEVADETVIKGFLLKDEVGNQVRILEEELPDSKYIETSYRPLWTNGRYSLLEVHLITGRTHQIRAHLASIGHPILGDPKYGNQKANMELKNEFGYRYQLLHAYSISFPSGETYIAKEPAIFDKIKRI